MSGEQIAAIPINLDQVCGIQFNNLDILMVKCHIFLYDIMLRSEGAMAINNATWPGYGELMLRTLIAHETSRTSPMIVYLYTSI